MAVCLGPACPGYDGNFEANGPCLDPCKDEGRGTSRSLDDAEHRSKRWQYDAKDGRYQRVESGLSRHDAPEPSDGKRDVCGGRSRCLCYLLTLAVPACIASLMVYSVANSRKDEPRGRSRESLIPPSSLDHPPLVASMSAEPYDCADSSYRGARPWSREKRQWCCKHKRAGCPAAAGEAAPPAEGCEAVCSYDSRSATCRVRIQFAAHYVFFSRPRACEMARVLVLRQCPGCAACASADAGCAAPRGLAGGGAA